MKLCSWSYIANNGKSYYPLTNRLVRFSILFFSGIHCFILKAKNASSFFLPSIEWKSLQLQIQISGLIVAISFWIVFELKWRRLCQFSHIEIFVGKFINWLLFEREQNTYLFDIVCWIQFILTVPLNQTGFYHVSFFCLDRNTNSTYIDDGKKNNNLIASV